MDEEGGESTEEDTMWQAQELVSLR